MDTPRVFVDQVNPFRYRKPTPNQQERMQLLSDGYISPLYDRILDLVQSSAERTLAIRKLQEFRMWVNAAIVLNEET